MPFKSEAQRRYLWANEPDIARDWADTYGSRIQKENGGIMRLGFQNGNDVNPWLWQQMKKGKNYLQDTITGGITNLLDNTILGRIAAVRDATNPRAGNYNPALQGQIDFMKDQGMYGVMDQSGLNKITSGALAGKNLQSLFGSNDLMAMYEKELDRATGVLEGLPEQWSNLKEEDPEEYAKKVSWHKNKVEKIKAEQAAAAAAQQDSAADALAAQRQGTRAADTAAGAFREDIQLDPRGGSGPGLGTWHGQTAAKERQGVQVAGPGSGRGAYFADGGLINFYKNGGFLG